MAFLNNSLEKNKPKLNSPQLPMIFIILDGWGMSEVKIGNAPLNAETPFFNKLVKDYPNCELFAHGKYVGLPTKQVGNSEAGHMNIGAGRVVKQDSIKISESIENGTFFKNPAFLGAIRHIKKFDSNLHIMGLLANEQSPHSDPGHLIALLNLAKQKGVKNVYLHLFTDGRDSPMYAASNLIDRLEDNFFNNEMIGSVMGRFYAMDRKKKWERTEMAYNALVLGQGRKADSAKEAVSSAYNRGESDEYIEPYVLSRDGKMVPRINDNDSIIFFNLRSDRARQLAKAFVQKDFYVKNPGSFLRKKSLKHLYFVSMTDFGPDLDDIITAFPGVDLEETLPMVLGDLKQLYLAETEKFAHVTYFLNGGYSGKVAGESQLMIPSPDVKSYDETPSMSSEKLTQKVLDNLKNKKYEFTVLNFAAPDMIGHTGNFEAGVKCCEAIDENLKKIVEAYLENKGTIVISADHENIEYMLDLETDEIVTEHSTNKVPFIIVNKRLAKEISLKEGGVLSDIAPTILDILGREKPKHMEGESLIVWKK